MVSRVSVPALVMLAVALHAAAGCGNGGSEPSTSAIRPTVSDTPSAARAASGQGTPTALRSRETKEAALRSHSAGGYYLGRKPLIYLRRSRHVTDLSVYIRLNRPAPAGTDDGYGLNFYFGHKGLDGEPDALGNADEACYLGTITMFPGPRGYESPLHVGDVIPISIELIGVEERIEVAGRIRGRISPETDGRASRRLGCRDPGVSEP